MKAKVHVTLKAGVLDPQGKAVEHALGALGFDGINGVRQGKYIEIDLKDADAGQARDRVEAMIRTATEEGATLAVGGTRPDIDTGFYVSPTLVVDATNAMTAAREEFFAPVITVIPFDTEDEAIAIANDSQYGLYNYVFTADSGKAMEVAKLLRSGNVGINTLQRNHEAAFGGFKYSGVGRDGGSWGLHAYSEMQSIMWKG